MPISDSFRRQLEALEPTEAFTRAVKIHIATVRERLKSTASLNRLTVIGSFGRQTFVRGGSDVDLMAVLPKSAATWGNGYKSSRTVLMMVRKELERRFRGTPLRVDSHAVVVHFRDCCVDVVPAIFENHESGRPVYLIPDSQGDWMPTSPALHDRWLNEEDKRSGFKLKRTAMLLKHWRRSRSHTASIHSFHVELLLASQGVCVGPKTYAQCVCDALLCLWKRKCRPFRDPAGIAGDVPCVGNAASTEEVLTTVKRCVSWAEEAIVAENSRDTPKARQLWCRVFNGNFHS